MIKLEWLKYWLFLYWWYIAHQCRIEMNIKVWNAYFFLFVDCGHRGGFFGDCQWSVLWWVWNNFFSKHFSVYIYTPLERIMIIFNLFFLLILLHFLPYDLQWIVWGYRDKLFLHCNGFFKNATCKDFLFWSVLQGVGCIFSLCV